MLLKRNSFKILLVSILAFMVGAVVGAALISGFRAPGGSGVVLEPTATEIGIQVQVSGAVLRPGVYELGRGARLADALAAAGGVRADGDLGDLNLAALIQDGQDVVVRKSGTLELSSAESGTSGSCSMLELNLASAVELEALPGLGAVLAQHIVDYRDTYGPFTEVQDLLQVPGIGASVVSQVKDCLIIP